MKVRPRTPVDPDYLRDLFSHNARTYDPVNTITSAGQVRRWRRGLVRALAAAPHSRVLDAGCGPGGLTEALLPSLSSEAQVVLADLSPAMLAQARARLAGGPDRRRGALRGREGRPAERAAEGPRLRFVAGDLFTPGPGRLEFERPFDAVLFGWGLRYLADRVAALQRLGELLRPEGRLAVMEFTRPPTESTWRPRPAGTSCACCPDWAARWRATASSTTTSACRAPTSSLRRSWWARSPKPACGRNTYTATWGGW